MGRRKRLQRHCRTCYISGICFWIPTRSGMRGRAGSEVLPSCSGRVASPLTCSHSLSNVRHLHRTCCCSQQLGRVILDVNPKEVEMGGEFPPEVLATATKTGELRALSCCSKIGADAALAQPEHGDWDWGPMGDTMRMMKRHPPDHLLHSLCDVRT